MQEGGGVMSTPEYHQDTLPGMEDLHWCETCEGDPFDDDDEDM
jgi:hypothetical protein